MTENQPITAQPVSTYDSVEEGNNSTTQQKQKLHVMPSKEDNKDELEKLPVGLKVLSGAQKITVKQHIDSVEVVLCCFARPCRYSIYLDDLPEQFLYVQEVSDCYARQIMGAARSFALKFSDSDSIDVMKVVRPQTCSRGCCGVCCQLPIMHVENPPGIRIAYICETRTCCYPSYHIYSNKDRLLFRLGLPSCYSSIMGLCSDLQIDVYEGSGETVVAQLVKPTKGNCADCIGQENSFTAKYLSKLSLTEKVILLGSVFLIDFHYFERQQRCCC